MTVILPSFIILSITQTSEDCVRGHTFMTSHKKSPKFDPLPPSVTPPSNIFTYSAPPPPPPPPKLDILKNNHKICHKNLYKPYISEN